MVRVRLRDPVAAIRVAASGEAPLHIQPHATPHGLLRAAGRQRITQFDPSGLQLCRFIEPGSSVHNSNLLFLVCHCRWHHGKKEFDRHFLSPQFFELFSSKIFPWMSRHVRVWRDGLNLKPIPLHPVRDDACTSPRRGDVYNPVQDALCFHIQSRTRCIVKSTYNPVQDAL